MGSHLHHEIEVAEDSATLYLGGALKANDVHALIGMCDNLPLRVRTLRLDMHGVTSQEDDAMSAVRGVLRYWRESRGGSFRLSLASERLVATYGEGSFAHAALSLRNAPAHVVEATPALMAVYI